MFDHLYPNFLDDSDEYALSEQYWTKLWQQIDPPARTANGWQQPWFEPLPLALSQGNPIFSAVSHALRRGIRVIQHQPTKSGVEIQACIDTFGGAREDPESIEELVISCALADSTSAVARSLMEPWTRGEAISLDLIDPIISCGTIAPAEANNGPGQIESVQRRRGAGPASGGGP